MSTDPGRRPAGSAADLIHQTVAELSVRAPAVVAAARDTLGEVVLRLRFGDGSEVDLLRAGSALVTRAVDGHMASVDAWFDDHAMSMLFDVVHKPVLTVMPRGLDVRGSRPEVTAAWRTLRLLASRASGLRAVQEIWRAYRAQAGISLASGVDLPPAPPPAFSRATHTRWSALDFLDDRAAATPGLVSDTVLAAPRTIWDGRASTGWWEHPTVSDADLLEVMGRCRDRVASEMARLIPDRAPKSSLYDLMRSYPARQGKGLRPTLTIAACAAFGGPPEASVRVAAALELFHNGFLIHDDIADESTHRRGKPTLHERHGVGLAVNAGDGLNLLAVDAVLSNLAGLGLASTIGLIHEILHMCRETVEGQAIELEWIRNMHVPRADRSYYSMSTKKTGWYTCISPCRLGAICAGEQSPARLNAFNEPFRLIGIAFQIQDDVLNLIGQEELYGKEPLGDLLEGKRTVMLIHLMRTAGEPDRERARRIIALPRMSKTQADAEDLLRLMEKYGSIDYARRVAERLARRGVVRFESDLSFLEENEGKGILRQIANYVTTRPL